MIDKGMKLGVACAGAISLLVIVLQFAPSAAFGQEFVPRHQKELEVVWQAHPTLEIGAPAPAFSLKGTDGKVHTLNDYKASRFLAIVFVCNHCPASQMYEERIMRMTSDYAPKGVQVIAIQPNGPFPMSRRELAFSDLDDSFDSMIKHAEYRHFNFPYLYDGDTQEVAGKYGPKVTPHIFIFDSDRKLRFQGRIDDNINETKVKNRAATVALDALLAGAPVPVETTSVFGCGMKWNNLHEERDREAADWAAKPVTLETATVADLQKLRTNPTGKTLMVHFWTTQCGPCAAEFKNLVETYLYYRSRNFDFVTVSANAPGERDAVLQFLQKEHAAVRNLQFESDNSEAMQSAFDSTWTSGAPFTVVISPEGKILYREEGAVSTLQMRRAILATLPDGNIFPGASAYWAKQ
jgi:peroxiredoxin